MNEREDLFVKLEPRTCAWCRHCGAIVTGKLYGYVCLGNKRTISKRVKDSIKPFPRRVKFRTGLQCVDADEMHECFEPTLPTDRRMRLVEALGMTKDLETGRHA